MIDATAVHPAACGCTSCLVGESVPLNGATEAQVAALLLGKLEDRTGAEFRVQATYQACAAAPLTEAVPKAVTVQASQGLMWFFDSTLLPLRPTP